MKKEILQLVCFSFAFILCTSLFAQNEKEPVKVYKNGNQHGVEVPPPPPPTPPLPPKEEIFKVVEEMPRFPGCEDITGDKGAKEECAKKKHLQYLYKNLKYPEEARAKGIEGMVIIQFIVRKDGSLDDLKIVRDVGREDCTESCGDATLKLFKKMQSEIKWIPGKQRGRSVDVQYTMPVKFKL
jgi:protein TonB